MTSVQEWLGKDNTLGISIWEKKYRQNNESFDEWLERVSGGDKDIRQLILDKKFLFGGRILSNRGLDNNSSLSNCYVIDTKDSISDIYATAGNMAQIFKSGGGVGCDITPLAPNGAKVNNPAKTSSGAVSFIELFTTTTGLIGQCIEEDQNVLTPNGLKRIKDVIVGDEVWTMDGFVKVICTKNQGPKEVYEVETRRGYKIRTTDNHVFVASNGGDISDMMLCDIKNQPICILPGKNMIKEYPTLTHNFERGTRPVVNGIGYYGEIEHNQYLDIKIPLILDEKLAYLIGYTHGNGYTEGVKNVTLSCDSKNTEIIEKIKAYCIDVFNHEPYIEKKSGENCVKIGLAGKEVTHFLLENNINKPKTEHLRVPDKIWESPTSVQTAYLSGLMDADGSVSKKAGYVITTINSLFASDIQKLYLMNGIISTIHIEERELPWHDIFKISVSGAASKRKIKSKLIESIKVSKIEIGAKRDSILTPFNAKTLGIAYNNFNYVSCVGNMSYNVLDKLKSEGYYDKEILVEDEIKSISPVGIANTYDITLESENRFWCEGFYVHNSGRRAALLLSIDCTHPDLEEFISLKTDPNKATTANLSVRVSDEFMKAVEEDKLWELSFTRKETGEVISKTVKAREIFQKLCDANYDYGEPGILFWDRIKNYNMLNTYDDFEYSGTNPCFAGDTKILTDKGYIPIRQLVNTPTTIWNGYEWSEVVPRVTGHDQPMCRVSFSNGVKIECTLYHKFALVGGDKVMAKQLTPGDTIQTFFLPNEREYSSNKSATENVSLLVKKDIYVTMVEEIEDADTVYCLTEPNNHTLIANGVMTGNCGELPLPAGGACLLGSINLAEYVIDDDNGGVRFDFETFRYDVKRCVDALDDVLDEGIPRHPLAIQRETVANWRQIGLGIMGLGDMLIKLNIPYGSDESLKLCDNIGMVMATSAISESNILSKAKDSFPKFKANNTMKSEFMKAHFDFDMPLDGMRNSQLLCIAPTGTISTMIGVSGGIEPLYALEFERTTKSLHGKDKTYKVIPKVVEEARKSNRTDGLVCSSDIPYLNRIKMQSVWQSHMDNSISSTINLPHDFPQDKIYDVYMSAWKMGLKGVTVFRDGCKREGILNTKPKTDVMVPEELIGYKRKIMTGCGSEHVCIYVDKDGNPSELFIAKGSSGGCQNTLTGLSRMTSLALRNDIPLEKVLDQLDSCGVCPSYAVRKATKHDVSKGSCCPSALANAIRDVVNEVKGNKPTLVEDDSPKCPECGAKLRAEGGCWGCSFCGFSKCS